MPKPYHNNFNKYNNIYKNNEFNKKLSSLKKYCPQSYKYLMFQFRHYNCFQKEDGNYELNLPTSPEFKYIYGEIKLKYCVKDKSIIFKDLEPSQFFMDGYKMELDVYKKFYYRDEKDKFKIDLMLSIKNIKEGINI